MDNSLNQIAAAFGEGEDLSAMSTMIFSPIREIFSSKENVESYAESFVRSLFLPFEHEYNLNEKHELNDSTKNPFNPNQRITSTTNITLSKADKKNKYFINQELLLDLDDFMVMMKDVMRKIAKSFGASDESMEEKMKALDDFKMSMINVQKVTYNANTTWVESVISAGTVESNDPLKGEKMKKIILVETTLE